MNKVIGYIPGSCQLVGFVKVKNQLIGAVKSKSRITGKIQIGGALPHYDGVYDITPSVDADITLETAQKVMERNLTVFKIPYAKTTNNSGGLTVSIGGN